MIVALSSPHAAILEPCPLLSFSVDLVLVVFSLPRSCLRLCRCAACRSAPAASARPGNFGDNFFWFFQDFSGLLRLFVLCFIRAFSFFLFIIGVFLFPMIFPSMLFFGVFLFYPSFFVGAAVCPLCVLLGPVSVFCMVIRS